MSLKSIIRNSSGLSSILYALGFLAVLIVALGVIDFRGFQKFCREIVDGNLHDLRHEYHLLAANEQQWTRLIHDEVFNQAPVCELMAAGWHAADAAARNEARQALLRIMNPSYENLEKYNFHLVHFHFPDGVSFLRMHKPEVYGDSLANFRPTVMAAAEGQAPVFGYEEGRVHNAYRNVFPLFYQGELVGTVEASLSYFFFGEGLQRYLGDEYQFVVSREKAASKGFAHESRRYQEWSCQPDYVLDPEATSCHLFRHEDHSKWAQSLHGTLAEKMAAGRDFGHLFQVAGRTQLLVFLAIENFSGDHAAFLIGRVDQPAITRHKRMLRRNLVILGVLLLTLLWMAQRVYRARRNLRKYESYLPVCATCKKVRQIDSNPWDPDAWLTLEDYFSHVSDAKVSHGICPGCYREMMGEIPPSS